jgi:hypothetical protein
VMLIVPSIEDKLAEAEAKAWESLRRYKFMQFGYWAAIWVHFNKLTPKRHPNPFLRLVRVAREVPR